MQVIYNRRLRIIVKTLSNCNLAVGGNSAQFSRDFTTEFHELVCVLPPRSPLVKKKNKPIAANKASNGTNP